MGGFAAINSGNSGARILLSLTEPLVLGRRAVEACCRVSWEFLVMDTKPYGRKNISGGEVTGCDVV